LWILKPVGLNRGRGLIVFNNINNIKKLM